VEFRILPPDMSVRFIHSVGHPVLTPSGELLQFVGVAMDVTDRRRAEEERERLRQAQEDLARVTRVTTMGELTASLVHEVNQPIAAAITNSNTGLRWLMRDPPDVNEAREALSRIVKDATRAADIIKRIRSMFKKGTAQREPADVNEVIRDVIVLLRNEADRYSVSIREDLATDFPRVMADRVQLQQVFTNLVLNGIEAMKEVNGARELTIKSEQGENNYLLISVSDTGVGLAPGQADEIFKRFSRHFSPPRLTAPAWDCRSAVPSSSPTGGVCGPRRTSLVGPSFSSRCRLRTRGCLRRGALWGRTMEDARLKPASERAKCQKIFKEEGLSGITGERPALRRCLKKLEHADTLTVWKLDRLARSERNPDSLSGVTPDRAHAVAADDVPGHATASQYASLWMTRNSLLRQCHQRSPSRRLRS